MSFNSVLHPFFTKLEKKAKGDKSIWACVVILFVISVLVVYSTSGFLKDIHPKKFSYYLIKQLVFIGIGTLIVYVGHNVNYIFYKRVSLILFIMSLVLLIYTLFWGVNINEGTRWVRLPGINLTFQTSDFAKTVLVIFLARLLSNNYSRIADFKKSFLPMALGILIVAALILPANLSTALIVLITGFLLLFIGRARMSHLFFSFTAVVLLPLGILMGIAEYYYDKPNHQPQPLPQFLQISRLPVWVKRVQLYMHRDLSAPMNYQNQQANIAIARGGLLGVGPGNSTQKYFLPLAYSDFIYAVIIEEYGMIIGIFVLGIYLFFLYRSIVIFRRCPRGFGSFLCIGLSLMLVLQAMVNILVNVDLAPTTGIGLPLISMGGSSYLLTCFSIGIILSVSRYIETQEGALTSKKQQIK